MSDINRNQEQEWEIVRQLNKNEKTASGWFLFVWVMWICGLVAIDEIFNISASISKLLFICLFIVFVLIGLVVAGFCVGSMENRASKRLYNDLEELKEGER